MLQQKARYGARNSAINIQEGFRKPFQLLSRRGIRVESQKLIVRATQGSRLLVEVLNWPEENVFRPKVFRGEEVAEASHLFWRRT